MDPNKYAKNAKIDPNSKVSTIMSIVSFLLMLIGLIGLGIEFFKDGGWLKSMVGRLFESTTGMLMIPVIIFAGWLFNRWTSSPSKTEKSKAGDIPMYIMMAIGAFYLLRIITTGGF
jgi:cation transport ATPase